jgi:diacylglycerol kinase (ATP)
VNRPAIHLLVNPAAGRGRALKLVERARSALQQLGTVQVVISAHAGHEAELATRAADVGARALVVLGGDGSLSHAARGLIAAGAETPLAAISAGTGNDFARSLGAPGRDLARTVTLIGDGAHRMIDAGCVDGIPFINAAGFGFDAEVLAHTLGSKLLRGSAVYMHGAVRHLFTYRGFRAAATPSSAVDAPTSSAGGTEPTPRFRAWLTIVFANGRWFGGGFRIAPDAQLDDGLLDCVGIADASPLRRMALFGRVLHGAHLQAPEVSVERDRAFSLRFAAPPRFQLDGELRQATSEHVTVHILPRALRVVCTGSSAAVRP